jgi:hypothetical protein
MAGWDFRGVLGVSGTELGRKEVALVFGVEWWMVVMGVVERWEGLQVGNGENEMGEICSVRRDEDATLGTKRSEFNANEGELVWQDGLDVSKTTENGIGVVGV